MQAFLDRQHRPPAAEIPRRRAGWAQDRAHAIGSRRRLDARGEMEADGEGDRLADLLAALGEKLVVAAHFLAVIAEHDGALVDEAAAAAVAVLAGLAGARRVSL